MNAQKRLAIPLSDGLKTGVAALALSFVLAPLAVAVQAQTQTEPSARQESSEHQGSSMRQIEEVVVTARRKEESAQTVPVAVTALSAGKLEQFKINNLDDLQYFDPSLNVSASSGRPNQPIYSLRGIRPTEAVFGQDPTVAIYMADVVLSPAKASNQGMYDLQSVQILKGPQGTLFGRNTTGGAILLTPQKPGEEFGGNVMVGAGSFGLMETEFGIDLPVSDTFAMRLAGKISDEDGHQKNVAPGQYYGDRRGGGETYSTRLTTVWDISDTVVNETIFTWDKVDLNGRTAVLQAVNPASGLSAYNGAALPSIFDALERAQARDVHKIESDMRERSEAEVWGIYNTTTIELNDNLTLKSIAAYRDMDAYEVVDMDSTAISGVLSSLQSTEMEHASYELQLLGSALDGKLDWVTGLYWYYEDGVEHSPGDVLYDLQPTRNPFTQVSTIHNNSYSVFGQGTYHFNDQWSMTAGARWTYDEKEMEVIASDPTSCALGGTTGLLPQDQCQVSMSESFSQPTGTVSLEYKPNAFTMLYASSRLGYRAGGFNARASTPAEYEPFDQETVVDIELGGKIDWGVGDWSMRTNVALYQQWYDDIQRTVVVTGPTGAPGSAVQNAAEATVTGLEIEQTISPTENLTIMLQYAYTDPEYKSWEDNGVDVSDTPFFFTPEHAFTATISYRYPLEGNAGTLTMGASAAWQDDIWLNALQTSAIIDSVPRSIHPTLQQDDYWLFGLTLGWENMMGSNLDLSAYAKNVTDEEYAVGGVMLYHTLGLSTKAFGDPRSYGVQLRYQF
jgi:iron complex outermembrane receptor protein